MTYNQLLLKLLDKLAEDPTVKDKQVIYVGIDGSLRPVMATDIGHQSFPTKVYIAFNLGGTTTVGTST